MDAAAPDLGGEGELKRILYLEAFDGRPSPGTRPSRAALLGAGGARSGRATGSATLKEKKIPTAHQDPPGWAA